MVKKISQRQKALLAKSEKAKISARISAEKKQIALEKLKLKRDEIALKRDEIALKRDEIALKREEISIKKEEIEEGEPYTLVEYNVRKSKSRGDYVLHIKKYVYGPHVDFYQPEYEGRKRQQIQKQYRGGDAFGFKVLKQGYRVRG